MSYRVDVEDALDMVRVSVMDAKHGICVPQLGSVVAQAVLRSLKNRRVHAWYIPIFKTHVEMTPYLDAPSFDMFEDTDPPRETKQKNRVSLHFSVFGSREDPLFDRTLFVPRDSVTAADYIGLQQLSDSIRFICQNKNL